MAKKNNRLVLYGAILVVGILGYTLTEPPKTPAGSSSSSSSSGAGGSRSATGRNQNIATKFTEEDEKAKFARLNEAAVNAFKPLIVDQGSRRASESRGVGSPNQVPPHFVNGESTWFFTGTTSFDGSTMALIENSATGEGQYLRVGESLLGATVVEIGRNSVTLLGPAGESKRLILLENRPIVEEAVNNAPFNPMTGPIGITSRPDTAANAEPANRGIETHQSNTNAENSSH